MFGRRQAVVRRELELDGIAVEVVLKRMKYLRLTVHPPAGRVRVSAPSRTSLTSIRAFVQARLDWIREQQREVRSREPEPATAYADGERHFVWGSDYRLQVVAAARQSAVLVEEDRLLLRVGEEASVARRRAALERWYREQTRRAAEPMITRWESLLCVRVAQVSVRRMTSRWGSCTPRKRSIRLNSELAKRPPECLEYIVVHELVHLLEASHNARFHALMDRFLPGWRAAREALRRPLAPTSESGESVEALHAC